MNFYYSLTFNPCGSGPARRSVWIPFGLVLLLLLGVGLLFCVSNKKEKRQSATVVVLSVLLSSAAVLCAVMGIYLAKELWFVRTIEEWQIESLSLAPN
jgi:FtsH-binding integral membrane protein